MKLKRNIKSKRNKRSLSEAKKKSYARSHGLFLGLFLPTFVVHPLTLGIAPRGHSLIEGSSHNKID